MAARLLARCLDLEQRIVDLAQPYLDRLVLSEDAQRTLSRLRFDRSALEHRLTPLGQRAVDDPTEFASLGDVLRCFPPNDRLMDPAGDLRRVRNALAHGSPVGWSAFSILDQLEARLR
jgi:hypothetical protein